MHGRDGHRTAVQARNQLGTLGGAKSFLRVAQICLTMSKTLKLCPTHFSRGGAKIFLGGLRPHWLRACRRHIRALEAFHIRCLQTIKPSCTCTGGTKYVMSRFAAEQAQHASRRYSSEDN